MSNGVEINRIVNPDIIDSPQPETARQLINELTTRNMTIAITEGVTGGALLDEITIPGSTKVFRSGAVAFTENSLQEIGIQREWVNLYGTQSAELAQFIASTTRQQNGVNLGIALLGGQTNETNQTYHLCLSNLNESYQQVLYQLPSMEAWQIKRLLASLAIQDIYSFITDQPVITGSQFIHDSEIVFPDPDKQLLSYTTVIVNRLKNLNLSIATVESCTGGSLANTLTMCPEGREVFHVAYITYDENAKMRLGVPLPALAEGNVYSQAVAVDMAKAARERSQADIIIATTGVMDTPDTRPHHKHITPGSIFYAIIIGQNEYPGSFWLPPSNRKRMKREVVWYILHQLNTILDAYKLENFNFQSISNSHEINGK
jgi:nicotinamide-nucleotide amidase